MVLEAVGDGNCWIWRKWCDVLTAGGRTSDIDHDVQPDGGGYPKVSGVEEAAYLNMPYDERDQQVTGDTIYAPCILWYGCNISVVDYERSVCCVFTQPIRRYWWSVDCGRSGKWDWFWCRMLLQWLTFYAQVEARSVAFDYCAHCTWVTPSMAAGIEPCVTRARRHVEQWDIT
jgi:hypothetical protein